MPTPTQHEKWRGVDRDDLIEEVERLSALLDARFGDVRLASAGPDGKGAFVFELRSGMVGIMAEHMAQIMDIDGGENFLQIEVTHPIKGPLTFTIERRFGRSPAVQLAEAKKKIAELESAT